jgi:hypothetical protein
VSPLVSREVAVSGDPRLAGPSPLLVPIPLWSSDGGRQRSGVAMRSGAGRNGHDVTGEYVVRQWRKSTIGWRPSA